MNATEIVRRIGLAAQRARSIGFESSGDDGPGRAMLAYVDPWLFDEERCILRATEHLTERGDVEWAELRNVLWIANRSGSLALSYQLMWHEPLPDYADIVPGVCT